MVKKALHFDEPYFFEAIYFKVCFGIIAAEAIRYRFI